MLLNEAPLLLNGPLHTAARMLWLPSADSPELPGRDEAQREAAQELAKPGYSDGPGLIAALREWIGNTLSEWLHKLFGESTMELFGPNGVRFAVGLAAVLLLTIVIWAVRTSRRGPLKARTGRSLVLEGEQVRLTGAQYRDLAQAAAQNGDWDLAITESFRAIATTLHEARVLPDRPSYTVAEITGDAGSALPSCAGALAEAGRQFNDVRYGGLSGTASGYQALAEADTQVQGALAVASR